MRIAVVGAGFSGLLTAVHLLRLAPHAEICLIERGPTFGPGTAYATTNPGHVLNVRLTNMSAFPDNPSHLLDWLTEQSGWRATDQFITRGMYGAYLRDLLRQAAGTTRRLRQIAAEVLDIAPHAGRWRLALTEGDPVTADAVVLALGVMEPAPPCGISPDVLASPNYIANPWAADARLPDEANRILLIGSGLTMVDVAVGLARPGRRFIALSRRGLLPRGHGPAAPAVWTQPVGTSPGAILSAIREQARHRDWRDVMDGVRTQARALWTGWSSRERRRFLRHLRPWWDVHRHRLAPGVHARVEAMLTDGDLSVLAGRTLKFTPTDRGLAVAWRPRGTKLRRQLKVDAVINCTGPAGAVDLTSHPLVGRLRDRGLLRPDRDGIGAAIDARCRLLWAGDIAHPSLFAVGPLTRGAFWEITSVPDIRQQALEVARDVAALVDPDRGDRKSPADDSATVTDRNPHPDIQTNWFVAGTAEADDRRHGPRDPDPSRQLRAR